MILRTFRPAMVPASLVACLCASLKYAGTVMTASVMGSPKYASASAFKCWRTIAEICSGEKRSVLSPTWHSIMAAPLGPSTTLYGSCFARFSTSENLRPISLLAEKMVLPGFVIAWRLAACPTSLSPDLVKATTDGVVLPPSLFGITVLSPPSMTAMQEFVVPKSIPNILLICHKVKHSPCQNSEKCGKLQH